jgi:hypothetical protein
MRRAAAVLLLTLLSPSIVGALCDVTCATHGRHEFQTAAGQSCHEERTSHHRPALADGRAPCHEQAWAAASTSASVRVLNAGPVANQCPSALAVPRPQVRMLAPRTSLSPPGIVVQTTRLRI